MADEQLAARPAEQPAEKPPSLEVFVDVPNFEIALRELNWPDRIDYTRLANSLTTELPGGPYFLKKVWCFASVKRFNPATGLGELSNDHNVSHLRYIRDSTGGPVELVLSHRTHPDNLEKGVDVNLATYMMERACDDRYQTAFLLSNDSDFAGVCRRVRERGKIVIMGYLDREYLDNDHLRHAVTRGYKISRGTIRQAEWQQPKTK